MKIERELGAKGQVVIPKDIRHLLGLQRGRKVVFEARDHEVVIKAEQDVETFLEDFFSASRLKKNLTLKDLKKAEAESYDLH
ncbi:MAG TPA: AbrB/MazE/SpoVT family DNA-binding domain-containing protein [Candidatus Nanoarchaeia archaeon]|nr:AbrB/MazE/SpoVT family DNA-binding domain-containing protein [Candidatus Nanoarchaeia archaeon]